MQKFSLLTFVCCLMFVFTACKKETLLETNKQDLSPVNLTANTVGQKSFTTEEDVSEAQLDAPDSIRLFSLLTDELKQFKNTQQGGSTACFGPITGICGSPLIFRSCYYYYQIWNDPNNLYVDLYFPSSEIGSKKDCNGRTCTYYIAPDIDLDLYNANGVKIGSVSVASSNITKSETRITFNISNLISHYGNIACVKLSGSFCVMKKCNNCSAQRVCTVCITPQQFCLQQCQSECPAVSSITIDNTSFCKAGTVNGTVSISGDASKVATTWVSDGVTYTGNKVAIGVSDNLTCAPINKTITATSLCTTNQSILKQATFTVTVNPKVSSEVSVDNFYCTAHLQFSCDGVDNVTWMIGSQSGTGIDVPLDSAPQTLTYSYSAYGCDYTGNTVSNVYCLPLFKNQTNSTNR